jgi:ABC-2 type transport system ATP-binding protein
MTVYGYSEECATLERGGSGEELTMSVPAVSSPPRAMRATSPEAFRNPAVITEGLERRFGNVHAVAGVDLEIAPGEIFGFLGPNGAGKSTFLRMLCTLLRPTAGRAVVAGFDVERQPQQVRLRIGVTLQDATIDPRQDGAEFLHLQGRLYGLPRAVVAARVDELERVVDLGEALNRRIGTYSGGMRRRLDLAASIIHNPEVLFLDEPTTGLDPESRYRIWDEVCRLKEQGLTVFLTTQYLEEADALADRLGVFDRGRLIAQGTPKELKRSLSDVVVLKMRPDVASQAAEVVGALPGVDRIERDDAEIVVVTPDATALLGPVATALAAAQIQVRNVMLRTPTLDDVFLRLTGSRLQTDERQGMAGWTYKR